MNKEPNIQVQATDGCKQNKPNATGWNATTKFIIHNLEPDYQFKTRTSKIGIWSYCLIRP
jgi:hypothetical protein